MSMPTELTTPQAAPPPVTPNAPLATSAAPATDADVSAMEVDGGDDDEAMQLALAMSMSKSGETATPPATSGAETAAPALPSAAAPAPPSDLSAVLQDASFLQSVLGSMPGIDTNDPRIQSVLNSANKPPEK